MTILENSSKSRETIDSSLSHSNQKKIIRVSFVGGARKPLANADSLKRISTKLGIDDDESNLQQTVDEEQSFLENSMAAFSASGGSSQLLHARQEQYKDTYTIDEHGKKSNKTNSSRSRINCSAVFMALVCIAIAITVGVVVSNNQNINKSEDSGSSSAGDTPTPVLSPPHSDENPDHEEDFGIPVPPPANTASSTTTTTTGSSNSRPQVVASSETGAILQLGGTILTMTSAEQQVQDSTTTTTTSLSVALSGDGTRLVLIDGTSYMGHVWEWMDDGHDVVTDKDRWSWHLLGNAFQLPTSNAAIKDQSQRQRHERASVAMAAHGNRIAMGGSQILVLDWNADTQKWSGVQLPGAGQVAMSSDGTRIVTIDSSSSSSSNSDNTQVVQVTAYSLSHDRSEWAQIGKEIVLDAASRTKANDPMVAMSSNGNRLVIAGTAFGIVTYDWDDSVADWFPVASPLLQGTTIALSNNNDNQLVVGNPHDGTVVVYHWSTNNDNGNHHDNDWVQRGSALQGNGNKNIQDAEDNDHYGYSVAGSNSRIVVGAVGYIQIWEWSDTQNDWEQVAKDITGEDHVHDDTGSTVAMAANGNRFAVSSRHHTTKVYAIIS